MLLLYLVLVSSVCSIAAGIDCTEPTDESCSGMVDSDIRHPWPCNCHRYWQCVDGKLVDEYCQPITLVFDPLVEQCVFQNQAPPGICNANPIPTTAGPTTPQPSTTQRPTTTAMPTTTPTTPRPTTTAMPTTTPTTPRPTTITTSTSRPATTTTAESCFACPECTCENPPSNQDNFFRPTPGTQCHEYYECIHNSAERPDCEWYSVGYDCGSWIFNPNQASCASPDVATCNE